MKTQQTNSPWHPAPDTVICIGAGRGEALDAYFPLPVARFLLVEPSPANLPALRRLARQDKRIEVLPYAISGAATPPAHGMLHILNNTTFNSLQSSGQLHELLPGLRETGMTEVALLGIEALIEKAALPAKGDHVLMLEALGDSAAILRRLIDSALIDHFRHVTLRASPDLLFRNDETAETCLQFLQEAGYELRGQEDTDICLTRYYLTQSGLIKEFRAMRARADETDRRLAEQTAALDRAQAEIARLQSASATELEALQARLADMEVRAKRAEGAFKDRDVRMQEAQAALETARAETAAQAGAHKAELEALQARLADMEVRAKRAEGAFKDRDVRMQEAQAALETARAETAAQAGAHKAELEALQARLEAKEGELGIALRSQAMTQSDLMHLRQRFETLQTEKNKVDALLTQVTSRLSIASKYLHLLDASARQEQFPSRSDTGPDRPTLLETPLDPRPKKRGKKRGKKP